MNIAAVVNMGNNIAVQSKGQQQSNPASNQLFGNVFGQVLSNQQVQQSLTKIPNSSEQNLIEELISILNSESMEEVETLLGVNELTVNPKELKELLNELLAEETNSQEELTESNVWDILAGTNGQANQLVEAVISSLNGQGPTTPVDSKRALQLLKVVQLIGNKSDLTLKQESTLFDLKQLLDDVKESVAKAGSMTTQNPVIIQGMKPVVQQVIIKQMTNHTDTVVETKEVTTNTQGPTSTIIQTKVETVSVTLPTEKPAQSEEFVKELQKAMNRVQFGQAGGANRLVIKLYPEQLGTIRIELVQKDGMLTTKMLASTALGKELLDSNSNQLKQGLANQNIQVEKLEITQALQDPTRQQRNQSFQESFRQQQQEQQETNTEEHEDIATFEDFLKEMEV
ncbi:flagellar hook-length control protein FliK [Psychrobacillus vulpis]|uniref:Flagellar hook-length control protein FliK n=1 Tax=Psychrobacillus vulpis TaxID=2325572 RepID=A0A544TU15_9BACI|nr:flagellar hook-length control protein FliK [Psychrobacillus vulpis]TQR20924.1 flagellar hook-length control protein FliK [Psychrobacillus vulpis]